MLITIKQTEPNRYYLTTTYKGVKYGQGYQATSEAEAKAKFVRLIETYRTKGDLYVARYGVN